MKIRFIALLGFAFLCSPVLAADHRLESLDEAAPADALAAEIAAQLSPKGVAIIRGTKRTVCNIWFNKAWRVKPGFKPTAEILYPFQPGQLLGVIQYTRKGSDFRDQDISKGVYTLRYGQQPVDGNHVGTSPTRDFIVLIEAAKDKYLKPIEAEKLNELSAEAAGSSHPLMLCLQKAMGKAKAAEISHNEDRDWWTLSLTGAVAAKGKTSPLPINLVIVGVAEE